MAEVYLELMSQRLAKDSKEEEDILEETISINSIKEFRDLTKNSKFIIKNASLKI